jgi:hypothetical protein
MSHELKLEDIDVDGAVRETAAEAMDALQGDTRSQFLRRAGLAGGAFAGGGAILGALAPSALAYSSGDRPPVKPFGKGDIGVLNFALVLEYLESGFYNGATEAERRKPFLRNGLERTFLRTTTRDEAEHVNFLKKALGKHAIKKPSFDYRGQNKEHASFFTAAFAFENVGVHAYSGQAFNISTPAYLAAALSIVTIEARHAAVAGLLREGTEYGITPSGAFDTPQGATKVLQEVSGLNYITKL